MQLLVGQSWRVNSNLEVTVLATSRNAVKLGMTIQGGDPHPDAAAVGNGAERGYYLFAGGHRWLVSWRRIGDSLAMGQEQLQIASIAGDHVVLSRQQIPVAC